MVTVRELSSIFILSLILSCNPSESENKIPKHETELPPQARAEKSLQDEVIAVHDEVMPKMDDLMRLKMKLQMKIDSLRESNSNDTGSINRLVEKTKNLNKADSAMMTWMRQFKMVRDSVSHEQRIEYLQNEKMRIDEVKRIMNEAIDNASRALK